MPLSSTPTGRRAVYLDLFKTLLVWGMVWAHVIELLELRRDGASAGVADFINLISFSGFMLAFGLGIGLTGTGRRRSLAARLRPALVILLCCYISSFAFATLVSREPVTPQLLLDLLSLRVLFGYSEFLASFFVLYVVIALLRPTLVAIADRPLWLIAVIALCLASTYLTTDQLIPLAGTVIGHLRYASFPLLGYLPWFLIGIRLGRRDGRIGVIDGALALVATSLFGWFYWRAGYALPDRFPPSVLWIIGPAACIALYLLVARWIAAVLPVPALLLAPGRHVLASLLLSNLAIFTIGRLSYKPARGFWLALALAVVLLVVVTLWGAALDRLGSRRGDRSLRSRRAAPIPASRPHGIPSPPP